MTFEKNFCPSPWFHMRINNSGSYEYCRWSGKDTLTRVNANHNISSKSPIEFFQNDMSTIRQVMLSGESLPGCRDCKIMEQHGKVSGRQRQLLKAGILNDHFEKSLISSPLKSAFDHSYITQGHSQTLPVDWQIDLGNYCNGACVFCGPESSSTLATEFKKIGLTEQMPPSSWCDDEQLLNNFLGDLCQIPNLRYLHFIGGETVITPAFKKILESLVHNGTAQNVTIGFTTNLMVWSDAVVELLKKFQQVNLGMSIETLTPVNDYVRYPSQLSKTKRILEQWIELGRQQQWLMQLRVTPTCLTVHDLGTIYDYAWIQKIAVESCNFFDRPKFLRISVLPTSTRKEITRSLQAWINNHNIDNSNKIINTRDPNVVHMQIVQDAQSYLNYLESAEDESYRLPELVDYIKRLESNRGNSILEYIPHYENLLRSAGY